MTRAFLRSSRLTIWHPRPDATSTFGSFANAIVPNALQVTQDTAGNAIRVQFKVSKSLGSSPNTCEITVTNLAEGTRAELAGKPRKVMLDVGYDGELRHLFSGDVRWAQSVKVGADWETTIEVADGGRAYREARVGRSWAAATPAILAIRACAEAMGLTVPRSAEANVDLRKQFAQGLTLVGRASDELSRLLAPFGLGWSVQDGSLQILTADEVRADQALVIDESAGMIGSPSFAPPSRGSARPTLTVQMLVFPQVTPGGRIEVRSQRIRGQFKVTSVNHTGDTHGDTWVTEIEAIAR